MKKLLKGTNFRERLASSTVLIVLIALLVAIRDAKGFKIVFVLMGIIATLEFLLAARDGILAGAFGDIRFIMTEVVLVIVGVGATLLTMSRSDITLVLVSAVSCDVFAYFTGNILHDKVFKSRPFPKISPKKSWEGVIGGYAGAIIMTFVAMRLLGNFNLCFLLIAPVVAIFGDWLESLTKRILGIKDSNEIVLKRKLPSLKLIEKLMVGHGGYADRIDSWVAVSVLMLWMKLIH